MRLAKKRSRNSHFGFATFATAEEAKAAFDQSGKLKIDGVALDVVYAKAKKEKSSVDTPPTTPGAKQKKEKEVKKVKKVVPGESGNTIHRHNLQLLLLPRRMTMTIRRETRAWPKWSWTWRKMMMKRTSDLLIVSRAAPPVIDSMIQSRSYPICLLLRMKRRRMWGGDDC